MSERFVAAIGNSLIELIEIKKDEFALLKPVDLVGIPFCFTMNGTTPAVWPQPMTRAREVGLYRLVLQHWENVQDVINSFPQPVAEKE